MLATGEDTVLLAEAFGDMAVELVTDVVWIPARAREEVCQGSRRTEHPPVPQN